MISSRIQAVRHALRGLRETLLNEPHGRIEVVFAASVLGMGVWLEIEAWEWVAVILASTVVIAAECLNTSLEHLADKVTREHDELVRKAKDAAAAGVLVSVVGAAATGCLIFLPRLWALIDRPG